MVPKDTVRIDDNVLRTGSQVLIRASGEPFLKAFSSTIERMTKQHGSKGILISTLWSAKAMSRRLSMGQLSKGTLKVVDTVSLSMGSSVPSMDDFIFLSTPSSLESILVAIERLLQSSGEDMQFLVLDSLTFLTNYYSPGQLSEFFNFLLNRMLEEEMTVIIFDQRTDEVTAVSKELSSKMDHTIVLSEGVSD